MMKFFRMFFSVFALLSLTGVAEHIVTSQPASAAQRGLARKVGGKKTRLQDRQRKQYQNQNPASRLV